MILFVDLLSLHIKFIILKFAFLEQLILGESYEFGQETYNAKENFTNTFTVALVEKCYVTWPSFFIAEVGLG